MQRDGCSHKYKDMKQLGQFREWHINKIWLEQRIHREKYQVCLARTPELILKEIQTLWNIRKQEDCIMCILKKIQLF